MTDFILSVMDKFKWFFRLLKVDYEKFRILLWAKLTVDNRQEKSIAPRSSNKKISNSMGMVVFIYAIMGIFAGILLLMMESVFVSMFFVFAIIMVMTAVALISDFTAVLLDTTDNIILLPRPIDSRTLLVARITHIVLYMLLITLSLSMATIVIGTMRFGPFFTVSFLISLVLTVLFVVFVSNVFYLLLMKISTESHFRDIILYFQIFMAAFAMGSYQILPRILGMEQVKNFTFSIQWWTYLLPPAWMAAPVEAAVAKEVNSTNLVLSLMGLFIPVISIFIVIRFLAPGFNRAIGRLGAGSSSQATAGKKLKESRSLPVIFSKLFAINPIERATFKLTWRISGRDRKFKLKTYPTFGYMMIIIFVLTVFNKGEILQALNSMPLTKKYIIFLYAGCILIPVAILQQRLSDNYEASWIYYGMPCSRPGLIQRGSLKALIVKFGFSLFFPLSIIVLLIWGFHVLDDILLAFLAMIFTSIVVAFTVRKDLPFSRKYGVGKEAQKGVAGFTMMLLPITLGLIHFGLTYVPHSLWIALPVLALIIAAAFKLYGGIKWETINSA
jgi:hypothetical protein